MKDQQSVNICSIWFIFSFFIDHVYLYVSEPIYKVRCSHVHFKGVLKIQNQIVKKSVQKHAFYLGWEALKCNILEVFKKEIA